MKTITALTMALCLTITLIAQDTYKGKFYKNQFYIQTDIKIPKGFHQGYDEDEGLLISINYGAQALIEDIAIMANDDTICFEAIHFPNEEIEWVEITEGLWINAIGQEEDLVDSFHESDEIKMHYAGFLATGEPFDNSFIRNKPLTGKLQWFISGFAIGAINVMPNTIRIIKISPELAYGSRGGGNVPPNSTIYYVIYNLENPRV